MVQAPDWGSSLASSEAKQEQAEADLIEDELLRQASEKPKLGMDGAMEAAPAHQPESQNVYETYLALAARLPEGTLEAWSKEAIGRCTASSSKGKNRVPSVVLETVHLTHRRLVPGLARSI